MKTIPMRKIGIKKYGLTTRVNKTDPVITKMLCVESNNDLGRYSSTVPKSFENRFKIRPDGFVSKKRNDVDIIPLNMVLCSLRDARTQMA